jgi:lipopolysaccharide export LptBFGC system permease protein LptF
MASAHLWNYYFTNVMVLTMAVVALSFVFIFKRKKREIKENTGLHGQY